MKRIVFLWTLIIFLLAGCARPTPQVLTPDSTAATAPSSATDLPATPAPGTAEPAPTNTWISYNGADGNIWLVDPVNGWLKQVTLDAAPIQSGATGIEYCCSKWSWDGTLLAYQRTVFTPNNSGGLTSASSIVVYNPATGQAQVVAEHEYIAGFAWRPVSHVIGYGLGVAQNYFTTRGSIDSTLATGIFAVNVDNGEPIELVKPERGFTLVAPKWSPNGQFLCFDEVILMEGKGQFACYNQEELKYFAWDKAIGQYEWSPDNQTLAYDYLTYIPNGSERIFFNNRDGNAEQQVSPDTLSGFATRPVFSPTGDRVAYLNDPMTSPEMREENVKVIVQSIQGGDAREYGSFTQPADLGWSADGQYLVLAAGEYGSRQVYLISLADGAIRALAQGSAPAWQVTR